MGREAVLVEKFFRFVGAHPYSRAYFSITSQRVQAVFLRSLRPAPAASRRLCKRGGSMLKSRAEARLFAWGRCIVEVGFLSSLRQKPTRSPAQRVRVETEWSGFRSDVVPVVGLEPSTKIEKRLSFQRNYQDVCKSVCKLLSK